MTTLLFWEDIKCQKKQIIKLLCLNLGIALLNVILFSAGFVGLNFSGDALTTALGVTVIVMSIVTFFLWELYNTI